MLSGRKFTLTDTFKQTIIVVVVVAALVVMVVEVVAVVIIISISGLAKFAILQAWKQCLPSVSWALGWGWELAPWQEWVKAMTVQIVRMKTDSIQMSSTVDCFRSILCRIGSWDLTWASTSSCLFRFQLQFQFPFCYLPIGAALIRQAMFGLLAYCWLRGCCILFYFCTISHYIYSISDSA